MGHSSDAVDAYQITSDKQREKMSKVISGESMCKIEELKSDQNDEKLVKTEENSVKCLITDKKSTENISLSNIGDIVQRIVNTKNHGKTVIKLEIEIHNDD